MELLRRPPVYFVAAVVALAVAFLASGEKGLAGMALGLTGATANLLALWYTIGLLGRSSSTHDVSKAGTVIVLIAFLLKLPVYVLLGMLAQRIGNPAPGCFLGGVGLVYFALVGWVLARS